MEDMKAEVHDPREQRRVMGGEAREGGHQGCGYAQNTSYIFTEMSSSKWRAHGEGLSFTLM